MDLEHILDNMEPAEALAALNPIIKKILPHLDEKDRTDFLTGLIDQADGDKLSSMVNL